MITPTRGPVFSPSKGTASGNSPAKTNAPSAQAATGEKLKRKNAAPKKTVSKATPRKAKAKAASSATRTATKAAGNTAAAATATPERAAKPTADSKSSRLPKRDRVAAMTPNSRARAEAENDQARFNKAAQSLPSSWLSPCDELHVTDSGIGYQFRNGRPWGLDRTVRAEHIFFSNVKALPTYKCWAFTFFPSVGAVPPTHPVWQEVRILGTPLFKKNDDGKVTDPDGAYFVISLPDNTPFSYRERVKTIVVHHDLVRRITKVDQN